MIAVDDLRRDGGTCAGNKDRATQATSTSNRRAATPTQPQPPTHAYASCPFATLARALRTLPKACPCASHTPHILLHIAPDTRHPSHPYVPNRTLEGMGAGGASAAGGGAGGTKAAGSGSRAHAARAARSQRRSVELRPVSLVAAVSLQSPRRRARRRARCWARRRARQRARRQARRQARRGAWRREWRRVRRQALWRDGDRRGDGRSDGATAGAAAAGV